ncbi:DUF1353 domain-containing protein [Pseudomonas sp. NPDC089554]|uniref:DUF1353 domain-containing protein n=1 Tax=Pseudomonas sp. NPDC089554 TaxID=3390653 RepID=UPI003CFF844A
MDHFPLPLRVDLSIRGSRARLQGGFIYQDPQHGAVQVPMGFETDFASVKPMRTIALSLLAISLVVGWFWPETGAMIGCAGYGALALYASVVGYGDAAATIHDWLYSVGGAGQLDRKAADQVFRNALCSSGVARWRAWLMWSGVRLGGHWRYRKG